MPFEKIQIEKPLSFGDGGLFDAIMAQSAERQKAQEQQLYIERLNAYTAASNRHHEQQLEFALVGLLVLFGGIFMLSFVAKRRKQIASAGEDAVVSALDSAVKAKRRVVGVSDRLKSKVEERLKGEVGASDEPAELTDKERRDRLAAIIGRPSSDGQA